MLKKAYKYIIILAVLTVSAIILAGCTPVFCAHEWTVWRSSAAADCRENGTNLMICALCDKAKLAKGEPGAHSFGVGEVLSQPTCYERGKNKYTCKYCGHEKLEEFGSIKRHEMVFVEELEPAECVNDGSSLYKCNNCSFTRTVAIPRLGHDIIETETKKPTCTEMGEKAINCSRCDYETTRDIPMLEHELGVGGVCKECGKECPTAGLTYTLKEDGTYELAEVPSSLTGRLVIASSYEGVPVTSVASEACWRRMRITELYIPSTIKEIKYRAFMECNALTKINFSEGLEKLGYNAFSNCKELTEVHLPQSLTVMEKNAFYWCTKLHTVTLSPNLTEIAEKTFINTALHTVNNLDKIEKIGNSAFGYCAFTSLNLGGEITEIRYSFIGNEKLESVTVGGKVKLGQDMLPFQNCNKIKRFTLVSSEETQFKTYTLQDSYNSLEYILLGDAVKKISYDNITSFGLNIFSYAKREEVTTNYPSSEKNLYFLGEWEFVGGVPTPNK